jgi:hypothetical protein
MRSLEELVELASTAMTEQTKSGALHRRRFLKRCLFGAATALEAGPAHSDSFKATKKLAGYINRDHPATQMCVSCHSFIAPNDCTLVEGPVSAWGWCNYYSD